MNPRALRLKDAPGYLAEIERRKEVLSWVPGKVAVGPLSIEDLEEDAA